MLQPDEQATKKRARVKTSPVETKERNSKSPSQESDQVIDDKYKGYELLLHLDQLENEPDLPPTTGKLNKIVIPSITMYIYLTDK